MPATCAPAPGARIATATLPVKTPPRGSSNSPHSCASPAPRSSPSPSAPAPAASSTPPPPPAPAASPAEPAPTTPDAPPALLARRLPEERRDAARDGAGASSAACPSLHAREALHRVRISARQLSDQLASTLANACGARLESIAELGRARWRGGTVARGHGGARGARGARGRGGASPSSCWRRRSTPSAHAACPISTGRGTRRVRLVRGEGRGVSG